MLVADQVARPGRRNRRSQSAAHLPRRLATSSHSRANAIGTDRAVRTVLDRPRAPPVAARWSHYSPGASSGQTDRRWLGRVRRRRRRRPVGSADQLVARRRPHVRDQRRGRADAGRHPRARPRRPAPPLAPRGRGRGLHARGARVEHVPTPLSAVVVARVLDAGGDAATGVLTRRRWVAGGLREDVALAQHVVGGADLDPPGPPRRRLRPRLRRQGRRSVAPGSRSCARADGWTMPALDGTGGDEHPRATLAAPDDARPRRRRRCTWHLDARAPVRAGPLRSPSSRSSTASRPAWPSRATWHPRTRSRCAGSRHGDGPSPHGGVDRPAAPGGASTRRSPTSPRCGSSTEPTRTGSSSRPARPGS